MSKTDKPVYHYDIEQGTDEWLKLRLGIITASEVNSILTPKGALAKNEKMRAYACELAAQRIYKFVEDHYESYDMQRGHFQEVVARDLYSDNFAPVSECGFITREIHGVTVGASPDGLVGDNGGIEIKSRLSKFQIKTIIADEVPAEYMNQIQTIILVSGREWFDFVQYSNGMPLYVKRVMPDLLRQAEIATALIGLEAAVREMMAKYKEVSSGLLKTERVDIVFGDDVITGSEA